jgi:hypothetical protein
VRDARALGHAPEQCLFARFADLALGPADEGLVDILAGHGTTDRIDAGRRLGHAVPFRSEQAL